MTNQDKKNKQFYIETRAIFFRVCLYLAIEKYSYRVDDIEAGELYNYIGENYYMRGKDVKRALSKYPEIKTLDKKTAIKMLRERSPRLLKIAHLYKFENYYKKCKAKYPDAELDLIITNDKRNV